MSHLSQDELRSSVLLVKQRTNIKFNYNKYRGSCYELGNYILEIANFIVYLFIYL